MRFSKNKFSSIKFGPQVPGPGRLTRAEVAPAEGTG
jgi:hypothetical protein